MSPSEFNETLADGDDYAIGWQGWYTVAVIVAAFVVMLRDLVSGCCRLCMFHVRRCGVTASMQI
jgi:hypothetical protein